MSSVSVTLGAGGGKWHTPGVTVVAAKAGAETPNAASDAPVKRAIRRCEFVMKCPLFCRRSGRVFSLDLYGTRFEAASSARDTAPFPAQAELLMLAYLSS